MPILLTPNPTSGSVPLASNLGGREVPVSTFYHGDCLFVMRHDIPPESVDLIYLDPPFFTGQVQKGIAKWQPGAMEISYEDSKRFWGDTVQSTAMRQRAPGWLQYIATRPRPNQEAFASYLFYMMERLRACKGVLKPTGSIFLHCDYRAAHYLKMVMDEIFGFDNLVNEVIWSYRSGGGSKTHYGRKHDTLFWYSKTDDYFFDADAVRVPYDAAIAKSRQHLFDERGKVSGDVWDISRPPNHSLEWVGYPTQKPEVLLRRVIVGHSREGAVVLDPFCGCGTTILTAHKLNRDWIGVDINKTAYEITRGREAQLPLGMQEAFAKANYISRNLDEVGTFDGRAFELWVNEFFHAAKPQPDGGVDGIMPDGTPIQAKSYEIKYDVLSKFLSDAKYHPLVPQPVKRIVAASKVGFDDNSRKRAFEAKIKEGIEVQLVTPTELLKLDSVELAYPVSSAQLRISSGTTENRAEV